MSPSPWIRLHNTHISFPQQSTVSGQLHTHLTLIPHSPEPPLPRALPRKLLPI